MDRRTALRFLASMSMAPMGALMAAPAVTSRLLLVFLRGAYDAASLLAPVRSSFYYESRPNIALAQPGKAESAALRLDADWGLHPSLRETVYPLFQCKQAAFVPFTGMHNNSRSHFAMQDNFELGQGIGPGRDFGSGFLNRLIATLNGGHGMAFTDRLPLVFQGSDNVFNANVGVAAKWAIDARQSALIAAMYSATPLSRQVSGGLAVREDVQSKIAAEMETIKRNAINPYGFTAEARRIALLMKERYHVGFVDLGGWDTHTNQGGASGPLASQFDELGRGLAAFAQEMGSQWKDTVVVVASEFGRTFRENGNFGTDHGHGTVYWILGGGINGGRVAGRQQHVDATSLFEGRDYQVLNEYRAVLAGLFARMYGLNQVQLGHVFPGVKPQDIGLI